MIIFNALLGFVGFFGWVWIWVRSGYNTHETKRVQFGVMLLGLMWVSLVTADLVQHLQPTGGTVVGRIILIVALFCLKSKLKVKNNGGN